MKKIKFLSIATILTFLLGNYTYAQELNLEWGKQMGGANNDNAFSIVLDDFGNVYTVGVFSETVDFDPGDGTLNFTSNGENDIYIQKLDPSGELVWVKQIGGIQEDYCSSIALDNFGNVYTVGRFSETADFDPGAGTLNLTSNGDADIFIQKLDEAGELVWAKQMGGAGFDSGQAITLDDLGNLYIAGGFEGTVDLDPGVGTLNLTSNVDADIFIQKLDEAGELIWVKQIGGEEIKFCRFITLDTSGNIYTVGSFGGIVDIDPGAGILNFTSNGYLDNYIQKLDPSGEMVWTRQLGGAGLDNITAVALDNFGNIYTVGGFRETVDFDPGAGTHNLTSNGVTDIFIQKLDEAGELVWAKQMGGAASDFASSIALDNFGNVYTTGLFRETADFDPGVGTANLVSNGGTDIFIQKLDDAGELVWVKQIGGVGHQFGEAIVLDDFGNIYTVGGFFYTVDFDPGSGTHNLTSNDDVDIFIIKLSEQPTGIEELESNPLNIIAYPNPTTGFVEVDKGSNKELSIQVFNNIGMQIISTTSTDQISRIDLSSYSSGIYYLKISNEFNSSIEKLIKLK